MRFAIKFCVDQIETSTSLSPQSGVFSHPGGLFGNYFSSANGL